jgi:hypothetical protein
MRRAFAIAGFVITLAALATQLALTIDAFFALGYPLINALIFNFAYFTVLACVFICFCYAADIFLRADWLRWFRRPSVVGFAVPSIALVVLVVTLILQGNAVIPDEFRLAEITLHYVAPPIFLIWWAAFFADGSLKFSVIPAWLIPPAIYLGLVFMRGAMVEVYPYPIFDVAEFGIQRVLRALAMIGVLYVALCALAVLADRWIGRLRRAGREATQ